MRHDQITLSERQRATHTYVVGQSGTGKSRALESWIMQDVLAGRGVGVIDPHGDLYDHLVARIAGHPELWEKVILFNPIDSDWVVGFNPLEKIDKVSAERLALHMTDISIKVWGLDTTQAPRMVWLLTNTLLALVDLGLTLLDLPRFLMDGEYRENLLERISLPAVQQYFKGEFPNRGKSSQHWVTPILNKLGRLLFDPDVRLIFGGDNTINFRRIMDEKMILLVNLSKGILGEGMSALLAAFIVAHIQKTALSRADRLDRPPFYFYLDEFQHYTTDNVIDILSESRKYALSLTLAHQFLDQLPRQLQRAVLNTAGTIVSFRVGYADALVLAKEIFPAPDFIQRPAFSGLLGRLRLEDTGWNGLALELSNLEQRQFWSRKRGSYDPVKQRSFLMSDPIYSPEKKEKINALRWRSGQAFARRKKELHKNVAQPQDWEESIPQWMP